MEAQPFLVDQPALGLKSDPRSREIQTAWQLNSAAWALFWSNFPAAAAIGLLTLLLPFLLLNYYQPWAGTEHPKFWQIIAVSDVYALMGALGSPALYYCALEKLRTGRTPGLGSAFGFAFRRWARVFGYRFMVGLLSGLAALALVVPGLMVAVRYGLVTPLAALEPEPGVDVMKRSAELVRGRAWRLFGAACWVYLGSMVLTLAVSLLLGILFGACCMLFASLPHVAMHDYQWTMLGLSYTFTGIFVSALPLMGLAAYLKWRTAPAGTAAVLPPPIPPLPQFPPLPSLPPPIPKAVAVVENAAEPQAPAPSRKVAAQKAVAKRPAAPKKSAVAKGKAASKPNTAKAKPAKPKAAAPRRKISRKSK